MCFVCTIHIYKFQEAYMLFLHNPIRIHKFQDAYMLCLHNPIHIYTFFLTPYVLLSQ